jgi:hypothetical protein
MATGEHYRPCACSLPTLVCTRLATSPFLGSLMGGENEIRQWSHCIVVACAYASSVYYMPEQRTRHSKHWAFRALRCIRCRYSWCALRSGNTVQDFKNAYRHVVTVLRGTKASFTYQIGYAAKNFPSTNKTPLKDFYAGDEYVDQVSYVYRLYSVIDVDACGRSCGRRGAVGAMRPQVADRHACGPTRRLEVTFGLSNAPLDHCVNLTVDASDALSTQATDSDADTCLKCLPPRT